MTTDEAIKGIFRHAGFDEGDHGDGRPCLIANLRPLVGIFDTDLGDIAACLAALHPVLAGLPSIDPRLCAACWDLCSRTRTIADNLLRRNRLASEEDLQRLEAWVEAYESFAIRALRGLDLPHCLSHMAELIGRRQFNDRTPFLPLLPALLLVQDDPNADDEDAKEYAAAAIAVLQS